MGSELTPGHMLVLHHGLPLLLPVRVACGAGAPAGLQAYYSILAADHTVETVEQLAHRGCLAKSLSAEATSAMRQMLALEPGSVPVLALPPGSKLLGAVALAPAAEGPAEAAGPPAPDAALARRSSAAHTAKDATAAAETVPLPGCCCSAALLFISSRTCTDQLLLHSPVTALLACGSSCVAHRATRLPPGRASGVHLSLCCRLMRSPARR